jgi:hypothetical protein
MLDPQHTSYKPCHNEKIFPEYIDFSKSYFGFLELKSFASKIVKPRVSCFEKVNNMLACLDKIQ